MKKILSSTSTIRFQDCDPFRHLNNARYVDYMLNAREEQVYQAYGLHLFDRAIKKQEGWVVSTSQVSFFRPAIREDFDRNPNDFFYRSSLEGRI